MLDQLKRYIIFLFIFTLSLTGNTQTVSDSLRSRLAEASTLRDSIGLLYKIYDSLPYSQKGPTLNEIYDLALRRGDYRTVNDVLKQGSDHYATNDSMLQVILACAEQLPDGADKRSTLVYLNVIRASNRLHTLSNAEREAKLREYLSQHKESEKFDTYKRIEYLFLLCKYLNIATEGDMLTGYLQELQTLINNLPESDRALKYLFYRQAALSYLANGKINESVEANKTLLNIINEFESENEIIGSTTGHYDRVAFACYNRLLRCHEALTPEEIEEYYSKVLPLIERNSNLPSIKGQRHKPTIYYLMAKKRYADVIPLIKEQLDGYVIDRDEQLYMVDALIKAAGIVGDSSTQLTALEMSNDMLKDRIKNKAAESYEELQITYEVNDLKQSNDELEIANQQIVIDRHKTRLAYTVIGIVILVIMLVVVFVMYRRSRKLTSELTDTNTMISDERDALRRTQKELIETRDKVRAVNRIKTDFISNIGHEIRTPIESIVEYSGLIVDCADTNSRDKLKQYAEIISLNTDMLLTLVNDVLELPSLENAKIGVHIINSLIQDICKLSLEKVRNRIKTDITLIFANEGEDDISIATDPQRVEQVLQNLMMTMSKYLGKGTVTLKYAISAQGDEATFTITGLGEPKAMPIPDNSIGVYISRMIADMLGGNLTVTSGEQTIPTIKFTIPIS